VTGKALVAQGIGAFLLVLLPLAAGHEWRKFVTPMTLFAAAYVAWSLFVGLHGINPALSFWGDSIRQDGVLALVAYFSIFLAGSTLGERNWERFFLATSYIGTIVALIALGEALGVLSWPGQPHGTLGNASFLAGYLVYSIFMTFRVLLKEKSHLVAWSLGLQVLALLVAQERGAIIATIGGACLAVVLYNGWKSGLWLALGVAGVLALFPGRLAHLSLDDPTLLSRRDAWTVAIVGARERPAFGWGQQTLPEIAQRTHIPTRERFDRAHNQYLEALYSGGVSLLVLYVALFLVAGWSIWHSSWRSRDHATSALVLGLLATIGANNVVIFESIPGEVYFWLTLAWVNSSAQGIRFARVERSTLATALVAASCLALVVMIPILLREREILVALTEHRFIKMCETLPLTRGSCLAPVGPQFNGLPIVPRPLP